jgi:hypothetical protein
LAIARAEQINPLINAIVHQQYAQAQRAVAHGCALPHQRSGVFRSR